MITDPGEAAAQLAYVRRLQEQTRLRIGGGYHYFLIWGAAWAVGFTGGGLYPHGDWWLAFFAGMVASPFADRAQRRRFEQQPLAPPIAFRSLGVVGAGLLILPFFFIARPTAHGVPTQWSAYWPFAIGLLYLAKGQIFGRAFKAVGVWLIAVSFVALAVGDTAAELIVGLAAGGAIFATGLWLRAFMRTPPST